MATILTVDDTASMRQMISFTLNSVGHEVIQASDGKEALKLLQGKKVDLVIADINMPNMDGITLVKSLREQAEYKFIPILVLTTESQEAKRQQGKVAGATGWIVKPFNPEQLLTIVNKVLG
ncbi:MAG: response regulator [Gammaproteobacteria bacterium]|nr:response regulator [Gammaproteobacteria bacterium]MDH3370997.1 response regulator [Gammaproteobacteria bacterium]MDH3406159.1 response regulator [Gammaproteobacteria bacterium]MDH3562004.1 response regulator [Gammaproteobacteria bacterium]MDH5486786.1 response regulator [Gammaproteobacteria bacterium]